ncbi:tyrosine-type recombinase/integrase [Salinibacterium sp.]|uniref:tyrosine-type recombinase/integrase n=1 Tax=Salinibacterium sp. TaxID=1915057 RepID=UPI00286C6114|nr:tyrosine-type recombinase/integrase [Salinibacterium sp.]
MRLLHALHHKSGDLDSLFWPGTSRGLHGVEWTDESFYRPRFRAAAEAIGRPPLRFHDLRQTAASLSAASGMPLEMVAAALGHRHHI